jgi:hypothetical protein
MCPILERYGNPASGAGGFARHFLARVTCVKGRRFLPESPGAVPAEAAG